MLFPKTSQHTSAQPNQILLPLTPLLTSLLPFPAITFPSVPFFPLCSLRPLCLPLFPSSSLPRRRTRRWWEINRSARLRDQLTVLLQLRVGRLEFRIVRQAGVAGILPNGTEPFERGFQLFRARVSVPLIDLTWKCEIGLPFGGQLRVQLARTAGEVVACSRDLVLGKAGRSSRGCRAAGSLSGRLSSSISSKRLRASVSSGVL